ncbi:MAG: hypothetical protein ACP5IJ_03085, partial [Candidatus Nanoarchaeia archaeon]
KNFWPSIFSSSRKLKKAYPIDISLSLAYFDIPPERILETKIFSAFDFDFYWREKNKEIDFIFVKGKKILPIEVKYKREIQKGDIKTLEYFIDKYKVDKGIMIYLGENKKLEKIDCLNYIDALYFGKELLQKYI